MSLFSSSGPSQAEAQIVLTLILLAGAVAFLLLKADELAIALVGAVAGQGAAVGVSTVTNGKEGK